MPDNKNFCHAPWIHLYTNPDSRLMPCCLFEDNNQEFPNLNLVPLNEAINHPKLIKIRQEFLSGETPKGCYRCKAQTEMNMGSYREKMNHIAEQVEPVIPDDGMIYDFKPVDLDIRFGNLCNLKCRTCSPTFSSSIGVEHNKIYNLDNQILFSLNDDVIDNIFSNLSQVKHIYLAGGEPLISENNYTMLNKLIEQKLAPSLVYNTNLTNIKYKDKSLVNLWKRFPSVTIVVSLDGYGEVNNYIRYGSDYEEILENINIIKRQTPHIKIKINSVASMMSMSSLTELGKDIISRNICNASDVTFSICHHPEIFDPTVLPKDEKDRVSNQFTEYIDWLLLLNDKTVDKYIDKCQGVVNYMMSADNSDRIDSALKQLEILDKARGTDYRDILKWI